MAIYWLFCMFLQSGFTTGMPQEEPTHKVCEKPAPHHHKKWPTVDSQSSLVIQLDYPRNCPSFVHSCSMMTC
ncbi:hypothetical protein EDB87DRAFT_1649292 [Lactarius vividus]|nr:hypothetical protein EDB87DRAFT_1649292 [Lactarius vividus]